MSRHYIASVARQTQTFRAAQSRRSIHATAAQFKDPRLKDAATARIIHDDFAALKETYEPPKHPLVLAHGLLGFDELHVVPAFGNWKIPGIKYWSGITEALTAKGVEVIIATVPPSGSIEERAKKLTEKIRTAVGDKGVNVIAGLDSRYMISCLQPTDIKILSLTTVASPHRGSTFADHLLEQLGPNITKSLYGILARVGFTDTRAYAQLTHKYMTETFNPNVQDDPDVRYFSYGAQLNPHFTSVFRYSHNVIQKLEGENDGLVSVESSKWGDYKGTLENVSHLDLINWTNKFRWWAKEVMLGADGKSKFNAIAFYLAIADMLAKEGL